MPLENRSQAKAYFRLMGCSHCHMARESSELYDKYMSLSISKADEQEWRREEFQDFERAFAESRITLPGIAMAHSKMSELAESLRTRESLYSVAGVTDQIVAEQHALTGVSRLVIAETIVGRQSIEYRPGLILLAADLCQFEHAQTFLNQAIELSKSASRACDSSRCERVRAKCESVANELAKPTREGDTCKGRATISIVETDQQRSQKFEWVKGWLARWQEQIIVADYSSSDTGHAWDVEGPESAIAEIPLEYLRDSVWARWPDESGSSD